LSYRLKMMLGIVRKENSNVKNMSSMPVQHCSGDS
jgi:hypothetical protein